MAQALPCLALVTGGALDGQHVTVLREAGGGRCCVVRLADNRERMVQKGKLQPLAAQSQPKGEPDAAARGDLGRDGEREDMLSATKAGGALGDLLSKLRVEPPREAETPSRSSDSLARRAFVPSVATLVACQRRAKEAAERAMAAEAGAEGGGVEALEAPQSSQQGAGDAQEQAQRALAVASPCAEGGSAAAGRELAPLTERRRVAVLAPGGADDVTHMLALAAAVRELGDNVIVLCAERFRADVEALAMLHMAMPGPERSELLRAQSPAMLQAMLAAAEPLIDLAREDRAPHLLLFNTDGAAAVAACLLAELLGCPAVGVASTSFARSRQEESVVLAPPEMGEVRHALQEQHGDAWRLASCREAEALLAAPFAGVVARWRADNFLPPLPEAVAAALEDGAALASNAGSETPGGSLALLRLRRTPVLHMRSPELFPPPQDWVPWDMALGACAGGDELLVPADTVEAVLDAEVKRQFPQDPRESAFVYDKRLKGVMARMEQTVDTETGRTYRQTKLREGRARFRSELWSPPSELVAFAERWKATNAPILMAAGLPEAKLRVLMRALAHRSRRCIAEPGAMPTRKALSAGGHVVTDATDWSLAGLASAGDGGGVYKLDALHAVPRQWLLERCRLYIHAGSAASTSAALAAGVPSLCLPIEYDHWARARALAERGLAPEPVAVSELTVERADALLNEALGEHPARIAKAVGACVRCERPELRAAHFLREFARLDQSPVDSRDS